MTGEEIKFIRNGKEIIFAEGKKQDGNGKKAMKKLKPLFDAILKLDGKKDRVDSEREKQLLQKLNLIFAADGNVSVSDAELMLGDEFKKSGKGVEAFLDEKLAAINAQKKVETKQEKPVVEETVAEPLETSVQETTKQESPVQETVQQEKPAVQETTVKKQPVQKRGNTSYRAFNETIQNMKNKYNKDEVETSFSATYKIKRGDTLYEIAVAALQADGVKNPNKSQIYERLAKIALVNGINDINNVEVGEEFNVGATAFGGGTGSLPVQKGRIGKQTEQKARMEQVKRSKMVPSKPESVEGFTPTPLTGDDNGIKKYSKTEGEGSSAVTKETYRFEENGVVLEAPTLEKVRKLRDDYKSEAANVKSAPNGETEEAAAQRKAENLKALKKMVEVSNSNITVITSVIAKLKDENLVNKESDEVKAYVQELIKTKDADVLSALVKKTDGNIDNTLFEKDPEALKTVAMLLKEIRAKENAGIKLNDAEVDLKEVLKSAEVKLQADDGKMNFTGEGEIAYICHTSSGASIMANNKELLDEFIEEYDKSDWDNIEDVILKYLKDPRAKNDRTFQASISSTACYRGINKEGIKQLFKIADAEVLSYFDFDAVGYDDKAELSAAYIDRVKELYLSKGNKGNLSNARYLPDIFEKMEGMTVIPKYKEDGTVETASDGKPVYLKKGDDGYGAALQVIKDSIVDSYFKVTKDAEGNTLYKFEPARRLTAEEMKGLYIASQYKEQHRAICDTITLDHMGKGQCASGLEDAFTGDPNPMARYQELIKDMSAEDVLDFIQNKMQNYKGGKIPFNFIMEKFADKPELMTELLKNVAEYSHCNDTILSFENSEKLAALAIGTDGKLKLPEGVTLDNVIDALPFEIQKDGETAAKPFSENGKKIFLEVLNNTTTIEQLYKLYDKGCVTKDLQTSVHNRAVKLIKDNSTNTDFISSAIGHIGCAGITYQDIISNVDFSKLKDISSGYQMTVFNNFKDGMSSQDFDIAVKNHWLEPAPVKSEKGDYTADNLYKCSDYTYRKIVDGDKIKFEGVNGPKDGVQKGLDMFQEVKNMGSGDIRKKLKTEGYVTKGNIINIIKTFKEQSVKYGYGEGIMQWLTNEWGPTREEMNVLPNMLIEKAKANGRGSSQEVKLLQSLMADEAGHAFSGDYAESQAKKIDEAMLAVIALIES